MDQTVTQWINSAAVILTAWDLFATGLPLSRIYVMVGLAAMQWVSEVDSLHFRHVAVTAGIAFVLALGINQLIQLGVHRARPYDLGMTHLTIAKSADGPLPLITRLPPLASRRLL